MNIGTGADAVGWMEIDGGNFSWLVRQNDRVVPFLRDWHTKCYKATGLREHRIGESLGLYSPKGDQGGWVDWAPVERDHPGQGAEALMDMRGQQPWLIVLKPGTGESLRRPGTRPVLSRCG